MWFFSYELKLEVLEKNTQKKLLNVELSECLWGSVLWMKKKELKEVTTTEKNLVDQHKKNQQSAFAFLI